MNAPTTLAAFGIGLAVVFGVGAGIGVAVGPEPAPVEAEAPAPVGEGVVSASDGYRLVPASGLVDPAGGTFRFTIAGPDGTPERAFTPVHERDLHLIVVNRELTSYHHLHPRLGRDGTWAVDLPPLAPGSYRAVADFAVRGGPRLALGTDLGVAGAYSPGRLPEPARTAGTDGYTVSVDTSGGTAGAVTVAFTVSLDGRPVSLQPYLGARGHLVAMRAGDLAYAHVHPLEDGDDGHDGVVRFEATLASAGRYALFLDFRHGGEVHTAAFTFDQRAVAGARHQEH